MSRLFFSTQISTQGAAPRSMSETSDRFLLNLSHTFSCQIKLFADFFKREGVFLPQSEIEADNFRFAFCEGR